MTDKNDMGTEKEQEINGTPKTAAKKRQRLRPKRKRSLTRL